MYNDKPDNTKQKVAAGLVALVVIGLLAVGVNAYNAQQGSQAATTMTTSTSGGTTSTTGSASDTSNTATQSSSNTSSTTYKDGTYSSSSTYYVPHGSESIKVTLTVKSGVVTDSSIENSEGDRESIEYQEEFASEYKTYVVGKPISSLQLSYVAGASDTTQGFNDALDKIRSEAQA